MLIAVNFDRTLRPEPKMGWVLFCQIKKAKEKVFIFTFRPFQPKAGLPRGGGVMKTLYL